MLRSERLTKTVDNLVFNNEEIERKVKDFGYLSSYYLHCWPMENTDIKREDLYYWVQEASFECQKEQSAGALLQLPYEEG